MPEPEGDAFKPVDATHPKLAPLLSPMDDHGRRLFVELLRRWQGAGGTLAFLGKAVAMQAKWEGNVLTFIWAHAKAGAWPPRLEMPFAALARKGVPADLLEEWKDDLTTVAGMGRRVESRSAEVVVDNRLTLGEAIKLVESAIELRRRI